MRNSRTGRAVLVGWGALAVGALMAQPAAAQPYPEPPDQAPAAPALVTVVRSAQSSTSSITQKTVNVTCPLGTQVTGGGGSLRGQTQNHVIFTRLEPVRSGSPTILDSFVVTAQATGTTGAWSVAGYAVCARVSG